MARSGLHTCLCSHLSELAHMHREADTYGDYPQRCPCACANCKSMRRVMIAREMKKNTPTCAHVHYDKNADKLRLSSRLRCLSDPREKKRPKGFRDRKKGKPEKYKMKHKMSRKKKKDNSKYEASEQAVKTGSVQRKHVHRPATLKRAY